MQVVIDVTHWYHSTYKPARDPCCMGWLDLGDRVQSVKQRQEEVASERSSDGTGTGGKAVTALENTPLPF